MDEPATAKALSGYLLRGLDCGALDAGEVAEATGLTRADLEGFATPGAGSHGLGHVGALSGSGAAGQAGPRNGLCRRRAALGRRSSVGGRQFARTPAIRRVGVRCARV